MLQLAHMQTQVFCYIGPSHHSRYIYAHGMLYLNTWPNSCLNDARSYRANESGHNTSWDSCSLKLDSSAVDRGTEGSSVTPRLIDLPGLEESEESHSATKDVWNQERYKMYSHDFVKH